MLQLASGGATRNALTKKMLEELEIEIPTIEEQKKIVSIVDDLQRKIKKNNEINENLQVQTQALYKAWFVDFEPFGGVMPSSWKLSKFGDIISIKTNSFSPAKILMQC